MDYDLMLELIKAKKTGKNVYFRMKGTESKWKMLPQSYDLNCMHYEYSLTQFTEKMEYPVIFIKEYSNGELYAHRTLEEAKACTDEEGVLKVYVGVDVLDDIVTLLESKNVWTKSETLNIIAKLIVFSKSVNGDLRGLN